MNRPLTLTKIIAIALFAIVVTRANAAPKTDVADIVKKITQLENDSVKAALSNSRDYLQKILTDDFIGGTGFGKWETKASMLKDMENPANKVKGMSARDIKVHVYGDSAIARYTMAYDDMYNGEHRARTVLCTDTWIKQAADWRQAASHCSLTK